MSDKIRVPHYSIHRSLTLVAAAMFLFLGIVGLSANGGAEAQEATARKIKTRVDPEYPELARRLNLKGVARVQVTVAPAGTVKEVKELGGNPVLLDALMRAVKKWKYEPADKESTFEVKFDFTGSPAS